MAKEEKTDYSPKGLARYCLKTFISFKGEEVPTSKRYGYRPIAWLWYLTNHPIYRAFFIIIIMVNVAVLSSTSDSSNDQNLNATSSFVLCSQIAFLLELIIKLVALEWKTFLAQRLNIMDFALSAIFLTLFAIDQSKAGKFSITHSSLRLTNKYAFLTTLRMLRLIMVA